MHRPLLIALTLLGSLTACLTELPQVEDPCAEWTSPGLYKLDVEDGRTTLIYVPETAGPRPAIVALHGAGTDGSESVLRGGGAVTAVVFDASHTLLGHDDGAGAV